MSHLGLADASVINGRMNTTEVGERLDTADVVVLQFPHMPKHVHYMREIIEGSNTKIVVEFDDNPYCVSPYNMCGYPSFGLEEVEVERDGEKVQLWKDGENGFDIERNKIGLANFTWALQNCHGAIATTQRLADVFGKFCGNVCVFPNSLDFNVWNGRKLPVDDDFIRIGWHGGISHYEDWVYFGPIIEKVIQRNANVKLVIYGSIFPGTIKNIPKDRIEHYEWADFHQFPYAMQTLGIDIGVCPLVEGDFNNGKSPLKWIEYAACGIPVVASDVPPYGDVIAHTGNGLLADTAISFEKNLQFLIDDEVFRKAIGDCARGTVIKDFNIEKNVKPLAEWFTSLIESDSDGTTRPDTSESSD